MAAHSARKVERQEGGRENPPPLGPSSVKEWITSSEAAMRARAPAAAIVGTDDGALGASSDVAMVDRGPDMASLAGNGDAAARRVRERRAGLMPDFDTTK